MCVPLIVRRGAKIQPVSTIKNLLNTGVLIAQSNRWTISTNDATRSMASLLSAVMLQPPR
jgi:hypothetical protein